MKEIGRVVSVEAEQDGDLERDVELLAGLSLDLLYARVWWVRLLAHRHLLDGRERVDDVNALLERHQVDAAEEVLHSDFTDADDCDTAAHHQDEATDHRSEPCQLRRAGRSRFGGFGADHVDDGPEHDQKYRRDNDVHG